MQKNFKPEWHRGDSRESMQRDSSPLGKMASVVFTVLALIYDISPIDLAPDAIPVLGWLDDIGVTVIAVMNLYQQFAKNQNSLLVRTVKILKWILILICVLAILVFAALVLLGVLLIQK